MRIDIAEETQNFAYSKAVRGSYKGHCTRDIKRVKRLHPGKDALVRAVTLQVN